MVRWTPNDLPVEKQEVMTSTMDIYWSVHRRWVKTLGNVMWL